MELPLLLLFRLLLLGSGTILLLACSSTNVVNLEGSDSTSFTEFRTSFPLTRKDETERIKIRVTKTSGEFNQDLADGKIVDFENFQLTGPDQVMSKTELTMASISYGRVDKVLREKFFMSAFVGVSRTNFKIDMNSASGPTTDVRNKTFEVYVDLGIYREVLPYLNAGLSAAFSRNPSLTGVTEWDVSLAFRPIKHMEIIGGYRWFKYDYFTTDFDSGIIVELKGPFIGLDFSF